MIGPTCRLRFAALLLALAERILPADRSVWGAAMGADWPHVPREDALRFAAGCLAAAIRMRCELLWLMARGVLWPARRSSHSGRRELIELAREPRVLGLLGAGLAAAAGVVFLLDAGAPWRLSALNAGAFIVGVAIWSGLRPSGHPARRGWTILLLALPIAVTALYAPTVGGASRWAAAGPFSQQVGLLTLPSMLVLYARAPDRLGSVGLTLAAAALALQPDRGMAGALACTAGVLLVCRPTLNTAIVAGASTLSFVWTLLIPDQVPEAPLTTGVLNELPHLSPLVDSALILGATALVAPALLGISVVRSNQRAVLFTFGSVWAVILVASVLGSYPTPLLGYGGTAILSYLLSAALLPSADVGLSSRQLEDESRNELRSPAAEFAEAATGMVGYRPADLSGCVPVTTPP